MPNYVFMKNNYICIHLHVYRDFKMVKMKFKHTMLFSKQISSTQESYDFGL